MTTGPWDYDKLAGAKALLVNDDSFPALLERLKLEGNKPQYLPIEKWPLGSPDGIQILSNHYLRPNRVVAIDAEGNVLCVMEFGP